MKFKKGYYKYDDGNVSAIMYLDRDAVSNEYIYEFKIIKSEDFDLGTVTFHLTDKQFTRLPAYGTPLYKTLNN